MRVKTLIAELSKLDPDARVFIADDSRRERPFGSEVSSFDTDEDGDIWLEG